MNEKRVLSFSKSERHTLLYKLYVKWSARYRNLLSKIFERLLKKRECCKVWGRIFLSMSTNLQYIKPTFDFKERLANSV